MINSQAISRRRRSTQTPTKPWNKTDPGTVIQMMSIFGSMAIGILFGLLVSDIDGTLLICPLIMAMSTWTSSYLIPDSYFDEPKFTKATGRLIASIALFVVLFVGFIFLFGGINPR